MLFCVIEVDIDSNRAHPPLQHACTTYRPLNFQTPPHRYSPSLVCANRSYLESESLEQTTFRYIGLLADFELSPPDTHPKLQLRKQRKFALFGVISVLHLPHLSFRAARDLV